MPILLLLAACGSEVQVLPPAADPEPLALTVDQPLYGAYVGDRATVSGSVSDPAAAVWIEGYRANVGTDGTFHVEVPLPGDFRVIDVEAIRPGEHLRERRPVFAGADPLLSWPGGLGLRLTPVALDHLAELVAVQVEALDLPGLLAGFVPPVAIGGWSLTPAGVTAPDPVVTLDPSDEGLLLTVAFGRIELRYDLDLGVLGTVPLVVGIDELSFAARATLGVDVGALEVAVSDTEVTLGDPVLEVAGIDPDALESLAGGLTGALGELIEGALDLGGVLMGEIVLPLGTIDATDLGLPLTLWLDQVGTDDEGVAATLGVDLGVPAVGAPVVPTLAWSGSRADLAVTLHEGLLVGLLESDLLSTLDLGLIELPGTLGEVVALPIGALPGGDQLPSDRTGMCLTVAPGEARSARLKDDLRPLGVLILPDVQVVVGVSSPEHRCSPWLETSLAVEVALDVEGTSLIPRISVVDGAVLAYDAEGTFDEDEIVGGLGALVDLTIGLLGGSLAIDLGSALTGLEGSALGEVNPTILDVDPIDGLDGVRVLQISIWD